MDYHGSWWKDVVWLREEQGFRIRQQVLDLHEKGWQVKGTDFKCVYLGADPNINLDLVNLNVISLGSS